MTKSLTDYWWLVTLRGIIALIFGLAAMASPVDTVMLVTVLIGLYIMVDAIVVSIVSLLSIGKNPDWWVLLVQGLVGLLIGFAIFSWPEVTVKLLFFLLAIWLLVMGIFQVVTAVITRKEGHGSWLIAGSGIITVMFGAVFLNNMLESFTILTRLMGLFAVISGIMTIAYSFELHRMKKVVNKEAEKLSAE